MSNPGARAPIPARPILVLKFTSKEPHHVRFLGELRGCMMHYDGDRTTPCLSERCEKHIHEKQELMYRGYAPAMFWDDDVHAWYETVLEITENFEEQLRGEVLRGTEWMIWKKKAKGKWLPMMGKFIDNIPPEQLREAFDVTPILTRLYRGRTPIFGARNMQEARVMAQPLEGSAPKVLQHQRAEPLKPITEEELREQRRRMNLDERTGKRIAGPATNGRVNDYV